MSNTFRMSGKHLPVVSASADIVSGALVYQEGIFGVAIKSAAAGFSLNLDVEGVHIVPVPSGTVKGDKLFADLFGGESAAVTLTKTATNNTLIGLAIGDRDTDGKGLVLLRRQPFTEVEAS